MHIYGIRNIALYCVIKQLIKKDIIIGVSGFKGAGKSTLVIQLIRYLFKYRTELINEAIAIIKMMEIKKKKKIRYAIPYESMKEKLNLENNIAYRRVEIKPKAYALPRGSCLSLNEASRGFYRRNWNVKEQKDLIISFWQIRFKGLVIGAEIQDFFKLDPDLRKMIDIWIYIPEAGLATVFMKDRNPFTVASSDEWHVAENTKLAKRIYKGPKEGINKLISTIRRSINYVGEFRFPPMPEDLEEAFETISVARKGVSDEEKETPVDKWKERMVLTIKALRKDGWSINKIAQKTGLNSARVSNFLNGVNINSDKATTRSESDLYIPQELRAKNP